MPLQRDEVPGAADSMGTEPVPLEVPARPSSLAFLRATASELASRLRFTPGEVDELRIAVGEAACIMLQDAAGEGPLRCRFRVFERTVHVELSRSTRKTITDPASFGWLLLNAVADDVELLASPRRATVQLTARREPVAPKAQPASGRSV